MGFSFRKSVKFGPVRVNFSKSGVGYSVGVKGFRVGRNAKGKKYIHAGLDGIYYQKTLSDNKPSKISFVPAPSNSFALIPTQYQEQTKMTQEHYLTAFNQAVQLAQSGQKQQAYGQLCNLANMQKGDANLFLWIAFTTPDMAEARRALTEVARLEPTNPHLASALVWLGDQEKLQSSQPKQNAPQPPSNQAIVPVSQPQQIVIPNSFSNRPAPDFVQFVKPNSIDYQLFDKLIASYQDLLLAFDTLTRNSQNWEILSEIEQYDRKRNAGATSSVNRKPLHFRRSRLPQSQIKFQVPTIDFKNSSKILYFLPTFALVYDNSWRRFFEISYQDLNIETDSVNWIEDDGRIPPGANIVGETWQYLNKNGGPDLRYADNRKLPIVNLVKIQLVSDDRLFDETIYFSNNLTALHFAQYLIALKVIILGLDPDVHRQQVQDAVDRGEL